MRSKDEIYFEIVEYINRLSFIIGVSWAFDSIMIITIPKNIRLFSWVIVIVTYFLKKYFKSKLPEQYKFSKISYIITFLTLLALIVIFIIFYKKWILELKRNEYSILRIIIPYFYYLDITYKALISNFNNIIIRMIALLLRRIIFTFLIQNN